MGAQEMIFTIRLDDGSLAEARTWDPESAKTFKKLVEDPTHGRELRVRATEPPDTSGHAMATDTITVSVRQEDDLEGHTMTLRFPSAEDAKRFQKRLVITGVLAASLVVGVAGAELASQQSQAAAPAAGPAITVQAPSVNAPAVQQVGPISPAKDAKDARDSISTSGTGTAGVSRYSPGAVDAQLRDSSSISGTGASSVISPAKDAKDASASGATDTSGASGSDISPENPGQLGTGPR
jgi:hypothetical protein